MNLEELRLNCLRMAYELGGKSEAVLSAANDLMNFVTKGGPEIPVETPAPAPEPAAADRIAACGTALEMPANGDLALAEAAATPVEQPASVEAVESAPTEAAVAEPVSAAAPIPEPEPAPASTVATDGASAAPAAAEPAPAAEAEAAAAPPSEAAPSA